MLNIVSYTDESYKFLDPNANPHPALETRGCGCCSESLPVTQENIQKAIKEAREWIAFLEGLSPVNYPSDVKLS